jgi:hypothetical protein
MVQRNRPSARLQKRLQGSKCLCVSSMYINTTNTFERYQSSCLLFKVHSVLETGFCVHLQVEPTQFDRIIIASSYFRGQGLALSMDNVQKYIKLTGLCVYMIISLSSLCALQT